jgi:hypothetical protein
VIAGGLALLAAPPVFQVLPSAIRNTPKGLALAAPLIAAVLAATIIA